MKTRTKNTLLLAMVLSVPALLYLNVWQTIRYEVMDSQIEVLESEQQAWVEENKKIIIGIEVLSSPSRIDGLALETQGLGKYRELGDIRIDVNGAARDN